MSKQRRPDLIVIDDFGPAPTKEQVDLAAESEIIQRIVRGTGHTPIRPWCLLEVLFGAAVRDTEETD